MCGGRRALTQDGPLRGPPLNHRIARGAEGTESMTSREPAGLWPRLIAFGRDYPIILAYLVPLVALGSLTYRLAPGVAATLFSGPATAQAVGFVLITLPVTLYFALSEASPRQATRGKRRVRLSVVDANGSRVSVARSLVRTAVKFVPWELAHFETWRISFAADRGSPIYAVGFIAVWALLGVDLGAMYIGDRRQTVHDRIAATLVVRAPLRRP